MNTIEAKVSEKDSDQIYPYRIFISHKVSEHGHAVKKLKKILSINNTLKEKLQIYVSSDVAPGVDWVKKLHHELDRADMLLYIYCFNSPPDINDWCYYETGYFAKKSARNNIVTVVPEGKKPPSPLQGYQFVELTYDGIERLLKRIYEQEEIYTEAFSPDYKEDMDKRIHSIITTFSPRQKRTPLSPRIWLTIKSDSIDKFKKCEIPLPPNSTITGETEAAKKFGYKSIENKEITLKELEDKVEMQGTLPLFFQILSDTLQDILNGKSSPWRVPPVKVLYDGPPNILVPAYIENMPNGDKKIEFVVTVPPINFNYPREDVSFMDLYNMFVVSWHFRWSVIEKYLYEFKRVSTGNLDLDVNSNRAKKMISKLRIDLSAVYLDSFNRKLQFPEDILRNFQGADKIKMQKIVDSREGLWVQLVPAFENACDKLDLAGIIDCLTQMQDINKTFLVTCLKFLVEFAENKMVGNVVTSS